MTANGEVTRRITFTKGAEDRIQGIMDRCGTNDGGAILRKALRLFEWAVEEVENGKKIASIDKDGKAQCIYIHE